MTMRPNLILCTDSYKLSHYLQYPPKATSMFSYAESRGGEYGSTMNFGMQYLLKEYISQPVLASDVDEADAIAKEHGEPFNQAGWMRIVRDFDGHLPVRIRAIPEGTLVPTNNVVFTTESTDPETFWLCSYVETMLVRLWYTMNVATKSFYCKRIIRDYLLETCDNDAQAMAELPFKLHDFGARGASCSEAAGIGGMSHLVNFMGTDTLEGIRCARTYYDAKMPGFSIPAAEHSTITSWGPHRETQAYRNMLTQFAKPGKILAVVSDSYNIWNAIQNIWCGTLRDEVIASGATVVIRPDSGNPPDVVLKCLQVLERQVGMQVNMRGFKVLPKYFRLIQGDGVNEDSIAEILATMKKHRYSASNIAFGMGGALLQKHDRDTQRFAYKCSAMTVDGEQVEVFKDPVDDPGKKSKAGRLDLVHEGGSFRTVQLEAKNQVLYAHPHSKLVTVFENGKITKTTTFDEVRARAASAL